MVDGLNGDFGGNLGISTRFEKISAAFDLVVFRKITTCLSLGLVRLIYEEVEMVTYHDPDGRSFDLLALGGSQNQVVFQWFKRRHFGVGESGGIQTDSGNGW